MTDDGPSTAAAVTDQDRAAVLEVVDEFNRALDQGDFEAVTRLCLDDFVFVGSGEGEESVGPGGLAQMLSRLRADVASDLLAGTSTSRTATAWRCEGTARWSPARGGSGSPCVTAPGQGAT